MVWVGREAGMLFSEVEERSQVSEFPALTPGSDPEVTGHEPMETEARGLPAQHPAPKQPLSALRPALGKMRGSCYFLSLLISFFVLFCC